MNVLVAAAPASEKKALLRPASINRIFNSASQENHASMCTTPAEKTTAVAMNLNYILTMELLTTTQARD